MVSGKFDFHFRHYKHFYNKFGSLSIKQFFEPLMADDMHGIIACVKMMFGYEDMDVHHLFNSKGGNFFNQRLRTTVLFI